MNDKPIINSLLDTDFYKFTMGQWIHKSRYAKNTVEFSLVNRSNGVWLPKYIDIGELRENLEHVKSLSATRSEMHYLRGTDEYGKRMFGEEYLNHFEDLQLPNFRLNINPGISDVDGYTEQFSLVFSGEWDSVTYWETYALAIVQALYLKGRRKDFGKLENDFLFADGLCRLKHKTDQLRQYPGLTFTDFGTRRRASYDWQRRICEYLTDEIPNQFVGTSNTKIAMDLALLPMGTSAHEIPMVVAACADIMKDDICESLESWEEMYPGLTIALTDTYGTEWFDKHCGDIYASWKGSRQDSGDPYKYAEDKIEFYKQRNIDPKDKLIVFSDGLDVVKMIDLYESYDKQINTTFGWGTGLTNDLMVPPISIVVKATAVNGIRTVKLSDNLAKALGPKGTVNKYKRYFGYTNMYNEPCRV